MYILVLGVIALVGWFICQQWKKRSASKYKDHTHIRIYYEPDITSVIGYLQTKPQVCKSYFDVDIGDPLLEAKRMGASLVTTDRIQASTGRANSEVQFKDTDLNYKGYIRWGTVEKPVSSTNNSSNNQETVSSTPSTFQVKYLDIYVQDVQM